jgi:hypothetical protein
MESICGRLVEEAAVLSDLLCKLNDQKIVDAVRYSDFAFFYNAHILNSLAAFPKPIFSIS